MHRVLFFKFIVGIAALHKNPTPIWGRINMSFAIFAMHFSDRHKTSWPKVPGWKKNHNRTSLFIE